MNGFKRWKTGPLFFLIIVLLSGLITGCGGSSPRHQAPLPGSYTLGGIGPGDADLLTGRAREANRRADLGFCSTDTRQRVAAGGDFAGKQGSDGDAGLFRV